MNETKLENETFLLLHEDYGTQQGGFLDARAFSYLHTVLNLYLNSATITVAVGSGILNIFTFAQMELQQGVNQNLLILSCFDFLYAVIMVLNQVAHLIRFHGYYYVGVITVSMCFLIFTVTKSSKFQSVATGTTRKGEKSAKAAYKEAQLIKTVIIILAIFLCCNIPVSGEAVMRQAIPGFSFFGPYKYEARVWRMVVEIGLNLNVSLNVVAYYTTNSAYRKVIRLRFAKIFMLLKSRQS
ncbi:hypothetical protein ElyMa_000993700 [Elysia marginata]|uniref:G-protein coupled receptors family 1 profile domain-containing protein n=1 Tax=Elysia marginata TaxID=1093978 RepID=A0AAV4HHM9_9GAST|nr:hypothetical protein ElyMa_000993700 [Elysia marginata]